MILTIDVFFTTNGDQYTTQYDTVADNIFVDYKPSGLPPITGQVSSVTVGERGFTDGTVISNLCNGTTLVIISSLTTAPFAQIDSETPNSTICGFSPSCDLAFTSVTPTRCTTPFNSDGTIVAVATTSKTGLLYSIDNINFQSSGTFTGLIPASYTVYAKDDGGCNINQITTVFPYQVAISGEKYRMEFTTEKTELPIVVKLFDTQNQFLSPVQLTIAGSNPLEKKYQDDNEYKFSPIIGCTVTAIVVADGTFDPNEFIFSDERRWRIEVYEDGSLDFQGWLLPDEMTDQYQDFPYTFTMVFTDGIASLKGIDFYDLNNSKIYGLYPVIKVWEFCFNNLGYNIGNTHLISSLNISLAADIVDQWNKTLVWGDAFYDTNGIPDDCYTVLEKTMNGFGLRLFQHNGSFLMVSTADLTYNTASYSIHFDQSFATAVLDSLTPSVQGIGLGLGNEPVNPPQNLRFDKAISILNGNVAFNAISLLNKDPSFEYGNIEGQLPVGWKNGGYGGPQAGMHKDPTKSYDGDWVFEIGNTGINPADTNAFGMIFVDQNNGGYLIDQVNKKVSVSFMFRPIIAGGGGASFMMIPVFALMFYDANNTQYWFNTGDNNADMLGKWDSNPEKPFPNSIKYGVGSILTTPYVSAFFNEYNLNIYSTVSFETNGLPGTGRLFLRICGAVQKQSNGVIVNNSGISSEQVYIDNLQITLSDAVDDSVLQISETHRFTNLQTFAKSQTKDIDADLYTYTQNKYLSGNVLYGTNYADAQNVLNMWSYSLGNISGDRLPKIIFESIARNYQRPMVIWEGDIHSDTINYFDIYSISAYNNKKFMLLSLTKQYKESINTVVAVEIDNSDFNKTYKYISKYKNNARAI
jgi:hypothetical protein